jgi:hypothetical protein
MGLKNKNGSRAAARQKSASIPRAYINRIVLVRQGFFGSGSVSDNPTSMIGLCQEGKSSPDALRRSASVNSFWFFAACVGLSAVVPISDRTRLPFAVSALEGPHRRLSLCFPASLETYQREHRELALLRPVGLTARPGRRRAEEILHVLHRAYAAAQSLTSTT